MHTHRQLQLRLHFDELGNGGKKDSVASPEPHHCVSGPWKWTFSHSSKHFEINYNSAWYCTKNLKKIQRRIQVRFLTDPNPRDSYWSWKAFRPWRGEFSLTDGKTGFLTKTSSLLRSWPSQIPVVKFIFY